ncbi:MAG: hypothetical protein ABIQ64_01480 [Candidatus Saccharimonadales bacterium]
MMSIDFDEGNNMFKKTLRVLAPAFAALGLLITAPAITASAATPTIKADVSTSVAQIETAVPTVLAAGSGGGSACISASSYGQLCAVIYQGTSRALHPYGQLNQSSTSPAVTSGSMVVKLCKLNSFNQCVSTQTQTFSVTQGLNKRPRCSAVIRGGTTTSLPCRVGGYNYATTAGQRHLTTVSFTVTSGGVTRTYSKSSPIQVSG